MVSGLKALKLGGITTATTYAVDSEITQTVGVGSTAVGYVASWDKVTGVLKYYQPMGLASSETGYKIIPFTSVPDAAMELRLMDHLFLDRYYPLIPIITVSVPQ